MNKIISKLKTEFYNSDLIIKTLEINIFQNLYVVFLETVSSSDKVNNYILKPLIENHKLNKINKNRLNSFLAGPNTILIKKYDEIEFYITNGFTVIILSNKMYAVETKADLTRSIAPNEVQTALNGPKDAFTENYQTNIGLIKRRLKTKTLKTENLFLGRKTNTIIGILYFEDITKKELIEKIKNKLKKIDIDGIIDSSNISYLLEDENKSIFPTVKYSERPDEVAQELLKGKVALVVDTSPFVLIVPAFFIDFINPNIDSYNKSINITFIRILRLFAFFIAILTPGIYNALLCFNSESIPMSLLLNFSIQRQGVPFPLIIEILIMLIICEILKESDLRYPSKYGSAISILGAIILGQAAVEAGIVSPVVIIIVAITFIASLTFSETEISNAIRYWTYIFLFSSAFLGLYGIFITFMFFLIKIVSLDTMNYPYFFPISPFDKSYFKNSVYKTSINKDKTRSKLLTNNRIKQVNNEKN